MEFIFREFVKDYFDEYESWFENEELKTALEGIDEEWLHYILNDDKGEELAVFKAEQLVAVIGVQYPDKLVPCYGISNIAIKPNLKNKGLGSKILSALLKRKYLKPNEYWVCFVDVKNKNGQRFFEKNNWKKISVEEHDMIRYEFRA